MGCEPNFRQRDNDVVVVFGKRVNVSRGIWKVLFDFLQNDCDDDTLGAYSLLVCECV